MKLKTITQWDERTFDEEVNAFLAKHPRVENIQTHVARLPECAVLYNACIYYYEAHETKE